MYCRCGWIRAKVLPHRLGLRELPETAEGAASPPPIAKLCLGEHVKLGNLASPKARRALNPEVGKAEEVGSRGACPEQSSAGPATIRRGRIIPLPHLTWLAVGDAIRTDDVQPGKLGPAVAEKLRKPVFAVS